MKKSGRVKKGRKAAAGPLVIESPPDWTFFEDEIPFKTPTLERLKDRIRLWTNDPRNGIEWACVLTGKMEEVEEKAPPVVDDFVVLPNYDMYRRQNRLPVLIGDIRRIRDHGKMLIGLLHTHPSGNLAPSDSEVSFFISTDLKVHKMVYIIAGPDDRRVVYHFKNLYNEEEYQNLSVKMRQEEKRVKKRR